MPWHSFMRSIATGPKTLRISLITTGDGSHSLRNEELNETYHSAHGALQESSHVFIKNGLEYWTGSREAAPRILEVGFGTGLNALLALSFAETQQTPVYYESLETYPLLPEIYEKLNYTAMMGSAGLSASFRLMHSADWGREIKLGKYLTFLKQQESIHSYESSGPFHIIFFDAFAPGKQPDMWKPDVMKKMYDLLAPDGILVTYCAQGQFKRNLKEAGFEVETLQGPPGKKEMVRGVKKSVGL